MEYLIAIYILELENDKFYVGKSRNFERRLNQHTFGKGSAWTQLYKIIKVYKIFQFSVNSEFEEIEMENEVTLQLMREKGWQNVRGGWWCNTGDLVTIKGLHFHGHFLDNKIDGINFNSREFCIFVLELENGKYFVGNSYKLQNAIKKHKSGKASIWTKIHKPIGLIHHEIVECKSDIIDISLVDKVVLKYFKLKGIKNVRGGSFVVLDDIKHVESVKKRLSF